MQPAIAGLRPFNEGPIAVYDLEADPFIGRVQHLLLPL